MSKNKVDTSCPAYDGACHGAAMDYENELRQYRGQFTILDPVMKSAAIVITTYNRPEALNLVLSSASIQRVMPSEIHIADDGSTGETARLIEVWNQQLPIPVSHHWQQDDGGRRRTGQRFIVIFGLFVVVIAALVATVNLFAYRYMLRAENQAIVQLLSGWGRTYKPILYDEVQPEIAVFGASWARDAFDPIETSRLLGRSVFNHGVSGGTRYETRRFADSALDNPRLRAAIINLNTFYRDKVAARFRYGFDESILNVDPDHQPNRFVGLRRAYSLALGGWAVGANVKLISTIMARDRGVAKPDYLESYEHGDLTSRNLNPIRERIFPENAQALEPTQEDVAPGGPTFEQTELGIMIDGFCEKGIDVYAYFTPTHTRQQSCDLEAREERAALDFLRNKQRSCSTTIHYFHFAYPNAMTLEGVPSPVEASHYYRPDGHPRPTAGLAMAASMFGSPYPPGTAPLLMQDFGVDLIAHADAEGWLLQRAARCQGDWGEDGYRELVEALKQQ